MLTDDNRCDIYYCAKKDKDPTKTSSTIIDVNRGYRG